MARFIAAAHRLRPWLPHPLALCLAELRFQYSWRRPGGKAHYENQMELLIGQTSRATEVTALARRAARLHFRLIELRWHPRRASRQQLVHSDRLTRRDTSRGAVISFMHHGQYFGIFPAIAHLDVSMAVVVMSDMLAPDAAPTHRQQIKLITRGGAEIIGATGEGALRRMIKILRGGGVLAIASDLPGRTEVTFLGRRRLGSYGAARLAALTDSVVYPVTSHRDRRGRVSMAAEPPLDSRDFADPKDLLQAMMHAHEPAILAWPESFESVLDRWGNPTT